MAELADQPLHLAWRPFVLDLAQPLRTARGALSRKQGWLLQLRRADGAVGWGEAAALALGALEPAAQRQRLEGLIAGLVGEHRRSALEAQIASPACPAVLAFALGAALAELDAQVGGGGWLPAPAPARLLPAGAAALDALEAASAEPAPSFKWKVAVQADAEERQVLERLLARLPAAAQLRLDANGGWGRATAEAWAQRLAAEPRLQWLEQPLAPADHAGLQALAERLPVALDESLALCPALRHSWSGWQVRRPSQDGDPRPLLAALTAGRPRLMLSTAFETGIARRWLHHLAALQSLGPTPAAPGLASDWQGGGPLLSSDPQVVWEAAA